MSGTVTVNQKYRVLQTCSDDISAESKMRPMRHWTDTKSNISPHYAPDKCGNHAWSARSFGNSQN